MTVVLAAPPGGLERLEVDRLELVEVVVEGRPAVTDPARQPGAGRGLAADDDRRGRVGHRVGDGDRAAGRTARG